MRLTPKLHSFGSTALYIRRDEYEPELLAIGRMIPAGSQVLDIGGSYGVFTLFMAHFAGPSGRVYSFEPGQFSYAQISMNVALNGYESHVSLHNIAASDTSAKLQLMHYANSPVNFSIGTETEGVASEEVPAERIDGLVPREAWPSISFIKIDVEGFEAIALEGARGILELSHPTIMFEVSRDALGRQQMTIEDMFTYLQSYGYRFWTLSDEKRFRPIAQATEGNIFASVKNLSEI